MVTVIVLDTLMRFKSEHPYFVERAIFGYVGISNDVFMMLPDEVRDTMMQSRTILSVYAVGGKA